MNILSNTQYYIDLPVILGTHSDTNFPYVLKLSNITDDRFWNSILSSVNIGVIDMDTKLQCVKRCTDLTVSDRAGILIWSAPITTSKNFRICVGKSLYAIDSNAAMTNSNYEEFWSMCDTSGVSVVGIKTNLDITIPGNITTFPGIVWVPRVSNYSLPFFGICRGPDKFVAVALSTSDQGVITSPDGITWTLQNSVKDTQWYDVVWGVDKYVAVADGGAGVMTSPDGVTWTARSFGTTCKCISVCRGPDKFVAVGYSGAKVMTSPDGITWTPRTIPDGQNLYAVCWGNNQYVAVASSGTDNRVVTSPDGITWTSQTTPADLTYFSVVWGADKYVAVATTGVGNRIMTSPDGVVWTSRVSPADLNWYKVTYWDGLFVSVAHSTNTYGVMTSPDGITWTLRESSNKNLHTVCGGDGKLVAVADAGTGNHIMTSTKVLSNTGKIWKAIKFNGVTGDLKKTSAVLTAGNKSIEFITKLDSYGESASGLFLYAKLADGTHYCYGNLTSLVTGGGVQFKNDDSATAAQSADTSILLATWYHIFITRTSAGVINIYINGVLSGTADQAAGTIQDTTDFYIGNNQADSLTLDGTLEHYGITTDIKTPTFIADRYNMLFDNALFFGNNFSKINKNNLSAGSRVWGNSWGNMWGKLWNNMWGK